MYPDPVGFWKVAGLTPYKKPSGDWILLGTTKNTNQGDLQAKLIEIDPVTGLGTELMDHPIGRPGLPLLDTPRHPRPGG